MSRRRRHGYGGKRPRSSRSSWMPSRCSMMQGVDLRLGVLCAIQPAVARHGTRLSSALLLVRLALEAGLPLDLCLIILAYLLSRLLPQLRHPLANLVLHDPLQVLLHFCTLLLRLHALLNGSSGFAHRLCDLCPGPVHLGQQLSIVCPQLLAACLHRLKLGDHALALRLCISSRRLCRVR
eukprot:2646330-Prymnesium_polylepis.2